MAHPTRHLPTALVATLLPGAGGTLWAGTYSGQQRGHRPTDDYGPTKGLLYRSSKLCRATWGGGC